MVFKTEEEKVLLCIAGVMDDLIGQKVINMETAVNEIDKILGEHYRKEELING